MAANLFVYRAGAEAPGLVLSWKYESALNTWTNLDLSSGYTFTLTLISDADGSTALTKTTNLTGGNGTVTVAWASGDLAIATGSYTLKLRANETATGADRDYNPGNPIRIQIV